MGIINAFRKEAKIIYKKTFICGRFIINQSMPIKSLKIFHYSGRNILSVQKWTAYFKHGRYKKIMCSILHS